MIDALRATATALADILAAENAALTEVDYGAAVRLVDDKRRAADAFVAAWTRLQAVADTIPAEQRKAAAPAFQRLRELTEANRQNLERAVAVQGRVIGSILRAAPQIPATPPRYGSTGIMARGPRSAPLTVHAHA